MEQQEEKFKKEIKLLKENKDNSIINTNNTTNNTDNSIINNNTTNIEQQQIANEIKNDIKNIKNEVKHQIIINNFGNENKDLFNDEERMLSWIDKPFNAIPHIVEKLHFTPNKRPENTNIRIANISNGKAQIYKNGEWKTIMKHELIYDLIREYGEQLSETYDLYLEQGKIERMHEFERFVKKLDNEDPIFMKSQTEKMDCKLVDCVKKNKEYLNSLG